LVDQRLTEKAKERENSQGDSVRSKYRERQTGMKNE
jgi:hypothetical protein